MKSCNVSAVTLVRKVTELFAGFRDTAVLDGKLIHFYKRAQILCGDLWAALGRRVDQGAINSYHEDRNIFAFYDIDQLTMFADYRVPQLLLELGVLEYDDELLSMIKNSQEIAFSSRMEVQ